MKTERPGFHRFRLVLATSIFLSACVIDGGTTSPTPLPSYGPCITFSATNGTIWNVGYFTEHSTKDSFFLQFSNTNFTLTESDSRNWHRFEIALSGNSTNFTYSIQSAGNTINGLSGSVLIPATNRFRFAAYGDNRTQYDVHSNVCKTLAAYRPVFVIHTGDMVTTGSDPAEWPKFFDSALPILTNSVLIPALGNHDDHSPILTNMLNPPLAGMYYYTLDFPSLKIIVLDTYADYTTTSAQYAWMTNELQTAGSKWKIVAFHNAPYSSTSHYNDADKPALQSILVPALIQYGVHLVLNGHDHIYERFTNSNVVFLTVGGGGAPLHAASYSNVYRVKMVTNEYHFAVIDMVSNVLNIQVFNTNLVAIDSFSVTNTN